MLALADTVLTRLEPILRRVADSQPEREQQGCGWCPICALAALLRGERHDLVELVASEGAVVVALLRQLLVDHASAASGHDSPSRAPTAAGTATPPGGAGKAASSQSDSSAVADPSVGDRAVADVSVGVPGADPPPGHRATFVPITVRIKDSRPDT